MKDKSFAGRCLALLLLASMLLPSLLCCTGGNTGKETTGATETNAPETDAPGYLFGDDIVIVRGDMSTDQETGAAKTLVDGIKEKTGVKLKFKTDWIKAGVEEPAEREILVGKTNRPESEGIRIEEPGDFVIRLVGTKIVLYAEDGTGISDAVHYFLKNCVDENGFTFGASLDEYSKASERPVEAANDKMKGTLKIGYDKIVNPSIIGGGVNFDFSSYVFINLVNGGEWGTGHLRSQHIPYTKNKEIIDDLWKEYFELIDYSGMQYVRLNVSFTMWEPVNDNDDPFVTDFDRGFIFSPHFMEREDAKVSVPLGFPQLNLLYLDAFYRLLDHFEEKGLYVILANWDNGSEALGFCPTGTNFMATKGADGKPLGRGADLNVADLDEYAETFAAVMYHLVEEKGYTCVKGFSFYNEPENLNDAQNLLCTLYNKFGEHLTRLGIREKTVIQAYDGAIFEMACDGGNPNRITDMSRVCGDNMDLFSQHMYLATVESGAKVAGTDTRGTVSSYVVPKMQEIIRQAKGKPVVIGELGTFAFNDKNADENNRKNYMSRILCAETAIECFNVGVKGYGLWIYNCYMHNYYTMLSYDEENPNRIVPDEINYYPSALMMKYLPAGTDIVRTEVTGCEDSYKHVWACAGVRPDGGKTILLVNDGAEAAELELPDSTTYHCFYVDPQHTDKIYEDGEKTGSVGLRPYSIVVLTDKP